MTKKSNAKKTIFRGALIFLLLCTLLVGFSSLLKAQYQEFAPIGAEWYYTNTTGDPLHSCEHFLVIKDTLIDPYQCKMVVSSGQSSSFADTIFFRQDEGKIYYYLKDQFNLIYDFEVNISDTITFTFRKHITDQDSISLIPIKCVVNDIQTVTIDGQELKKIFTTFLLSAFPGWFNDNQVNYDYVETIGHTRVFMVELSDWVDMAVPTRELRCYSDEDINYTTNWWQNYNLPCNYYGYTLIEEQKKLSKISTYPNPVRDELHIISHDFSLYADCSIFNSVGELLIKFNMNNQDKIINMSMLSSGIYFLEYKTESTYSINKIIKY